MEFGYTRDLHQQGSTAGLSPLWDSGFNLVHAKVNVVKENAGKQAWLPAISGGFVARTQDRNVSGLLATPHKSYTNADFYVVASKTITQTKPVPIVLNLGYKATNASVYGLAGNAPAYKGRLFGAAAFVFTGPAKSTLIFGSEFSQEPRQVQNLPGADRADHHHLRRADCALGEAEIQYRFRRGPGGRHHRTGRESESAASIRPGSIVRTIDGNTGENSLMADAQQKRGLGTLALACRPGARPHHDGAGGPDLRHIELRLQGRRHGGESFRVARVRQHLLAPDEPHQRRAGEAAGRARWRHRRAGVRLGPGGHRRRDPHHHPRRAELHFRHQPVRRHLDALHPDPEEAGHRGAVLQFRSSRGDRQAGGREHPPGVPGIGRESQERRAGFSAPSPTPPTSTACR